MTYFIPICLICIYATTLTFILKRNIEKNIPISVVIIVLIIYLFGMFNNLKLGIKIVEVIAIIQIAIILYVLCREKSKDRVKEKIERILTPGILIYIILCLFFIVINKGRILEEYDEFNHWGKIIKNMFIYNSYVTDSESIVNFNEYPPFTGIFGYLFLMIKAIYSEDILITAHCILYLSIIIPITQKLKWDKSLKNLVYIVPSIICIPLIFYPDFYLNILNDGILGVIFGICIFYVYQNEEMILKYINIISMLIMLTLTKTSGIALAVLVILNLLIKIIKDRKKDKINFKKQLKIFMIMIAVIIMLLSMWYIKVKGTTKRWDFNNYLKTESKVNKADTLHTFIKAIFYDQVITNKNLTVLITSLIIICISLLISKKLKENKKEENDCIKFMIISIGIYMIFLYITYIKIFDPIEAENIASFNRYASTILLANIIFQVFVFIDLEEKINIEKLLIFITLIIAFIPQSNINEKYINGKNYIATSNMNRNIYTQLKEYKSKLKKENRILYISGPKANIEYLKAMNEYEMMPIRIDRMMQTINCSSEEFCETLKKYDYVYIYRIDKEDEELIKDNFENSIIKKDTLYKVIYEKETLMLREVEK